MRRNGEPEDARDFLDSRPTRLCLGEPRLLEMPLEMLLLPADGEAAESFRFWPTGDSNPDARGAGGADDGAGLASCVASVRTKRDGFRGVMLLLPSSVAFDRFWGEKGVVGAMFSVSRSSSNRSWRRLTGEENVDFKTEGFSDAMIAKKIAVHC